MKKTIRIMLLALLAAALLTGCFGADPKVEKAGEQLIKAYLSEHYKKAKLESCDQLVARPAADRLEGTPWVHGNFSVGEDRYEYWANTATGDIYTDERVAELCAVTAEELAEALGFAPGDVAADVYPMLILEDDVRYDLLPVDIGDLRAYARAALTDPDVKLRIYAGGLWEVTEAQVQALLDGWAGVELTWYPLKTMPTPAEASDYRYWKDLEYSFIVKTPDY